MALAPHSYVLFFITSESPSSSLRPFSSGPKSSCLGRAFSFIEAATLTPAHFGSPTTRASDSFLLRPSIWCFHFSFIRKAGCYEALLRFTSGVFLPLLTFLHRSSLLVRRFDVPFSVCIVFTGPTALGAMTPKRFTSSNSFTGAPVVTKIWFSRSARHPSDDEDAFFSLDRYCTPP